MKVYISVDMDGCAGITSLDDVLPGRPDYQRARGYMTAEANAAIEGAFEAGASKVVVSDSHATCCNLLMDELHKDALLIRGFPRPLIMMEGIDDTFDAAFFIGYHTMAGHPKGVISHSFVFNTVYNMRLNGQPIGETGFNAAIAGYFGVPVALISGDNFLNEEAKKIVPWAEGVTTKWSESWSAACSLSPKASQKLTKAAAKKALENISSMKPLVFDKPYRLEVDTNQPIHANVGADIPGVEWTNGRTLAYENNDITKVVQVYRAMTNTSLGDMHI